MAKHQCGSCHFFQTSTERDKLGWCTHPERQVSTDVRILVRAGELRCRNDWGSDLWRDKDSADQVLDVVMHEAPVANRRARRGDTDRLVAEARPDVVAAPLIGLTMADRDAESTPGIRTVTNSLDSELVRRARQRFIERQGTRGYAIASSPAPEQEREAIVISNDYVPPSGQETPVDSPVRFAERNISESSFHEVPDVTEDAGLPLRIKQSNRQPRRTDDFENVTIRHLEERAPDRDRPEPSAKGLDPAPTNEPTRWDAPSRDEQLASTASEEREWWPEEDALILSDDRGRVVIADEESLDDWSSAAPSDPAPLPFSLWSDIVVSCETCRDFRPAGAGGRGWCESKWAFKHRRMVDSDECPCETSIGHWWLPADAAWQGDYDSIELGQPTPLMDKYFGRPDTGVDEIPLERRRRQS